MIEVMVSSTTFGFGLFLDAWQTLGLLFSYLNSVAIALMLAGVLYKVVQQDSHHNCLACSLSIFCLKTTLRLCLSSPHPKSRRGAKV